jgi:hypothetical protein
MRQRKVVAVSNNTSDTPVPTADASEALGGRWLWPPLILALTLLLILWLGRSPRAGASGAHAASAHAPAAQTAAPWPDLGAAQKLLAIPVIRSMRGRSCTPFGLW